MKGRMGMKEVRLAGGGMAIKQLLLVKAARGHRRALALPPAGGAARKGVLAAPAREADGKVLGGGRLLADERAPAVPGDVIGAGPAVARAHPLPVLQRDVRLDVVIEPGDRPALMRLGRGMIAL